MYKRAYKLFKVRKDGSIGSLFINSKARYEINRWMVAQPLHKPGFQFRPGWHSMSKPEAPHLSLKGRAWFVVEIDEYSDEFRPKNQGGKWHLSRWLRIIRPLTPYENKRIINYENAKSS